MTTPVTAPSFAPGPLEDGDLNTAFSTLTSAINALIGRVDALVAPSAPDLSGYATTAALELHRTTPTQHPQLVRVPAIPNTSDVRLQKVDGTIGGGGTVTVTFPVAYSTVHSIVLSMRSAGSAYLTSNTAVDALVTGTAAATFTLWVIGY